MNSIITLPVYDDKVIGLARDTDLVLLDIDDVVLTPVQYVCGSVWYGRYHMANKNVLSPQRLIDDFYKCLNSTQYRPVSAKMVGDFSMLTHRVPK
jgi:hypothetical protein